MRRSGRWVTLNVAVLLAVIIVWRLRRRYGGPAAASTRG